ncbi:hypothetical protein ATANTOWER_027618 [Ataeniobius toweri]|uniref:Uncharacterized protein n=1 Tax=Ataeniobius toweri TaxID=208326 RepID=A0ABU7B2H7_9TELE|nr:hypothetical protein [Ataeniobius toweri]
MELKLRFSSETNDILKAQITPKVILDNINWPRDEDIDEETVSLDNHSRIMSYLRQFKETGASDVSKSLLTFWTGWDVLSSNLDVEVIDCALPQASTCFLTLRFELDSKTM